MQVWGGLRGAALRFRRRIPLDWRELQKLFGLTVMGVFILLIGWGIVELRDPWPGSLLYRLVFLESRYFTVSAEAEDLIQFAPIQRNAVTEEQDRTAQTAPHLHPQYFI